ncbi:MAG: hypothetical protein HY863_05485 [Chloroflexi bacterium]|nr:hypothetical protein [Chloroflexota bacterium]
MNKPRPKFFSLLFDLLIDFALIGVGAVLYYHFEVLPLASVGLSPLIINLFGSRELAILVISLLPFGIGLISLIRTIYRAITGLVLSTKL